MTPDTFSQQTELQAIEQALQEAVTQHQAGHLQKAEELYRAILKIKPNYPEANHNMGVLAVQRKQPAAGLSYFIAALKSDPSCKQYWLSYIDALFQADQLEEARQILAYAKQQGLEGDDVEVLALRLDGGAQITGQSIAKDQDTFKEALSVESAT